MNENMTILSLFLDASLVVQAIMLSLLALSVISWTMIFKKVKELKFARANVVVFEEKFWSGVDLSRLYAELSKRRHGGIGIESWHHEP